MLWNSIRDYIRLLDKITSVQEGYQDLAILKCMNHEPYCVLEYFYINWHVKDLLLLLLLLQYYRI